jgi:hypothetical protein
VRQRYYGEEQLYCGDVAVGWLGQARARARARARAGGMMWVYVVGRRSENRVESCRVVSRCGMAIRFDVLARLACGHTGPGDGGRRTEDGGRAA